MKIPVYTDQQFEEMLAPIPAGKYEFKVIKAEEAVSQRSGNNMIVLTLLLNIPGEEFTVMSWLTFVEPPTPEEYPNKALFKKRERSHAFTLQIIRDFLQCVKLPYTEDSLSPEKVLNKSGELMIKLSKRKDGKGLCAEVDYYITNQNRPISNAEVTKSSMAAQMPPKTDADTKTFDDDIPF